MTSFIAESVFWGAIAVLAAVIYQAAILPGMRLSLRYRVFALRDRLRLLVMNGTVDEASASFQLLHENLNTMSSSLHRYDLARLVRGLELMDEETKRRATERNRVMEEAPDHVKEIYQESLHVFMLAFIFNSIFFFIFATICLVLFTLVKVGLVRLKDAVVRRVDEDTKLAFFEPELAAV